MRFLFSAILFLSLLSQQVVAEGVRNKPIKRYFLNLSFASVLSTNGWETLETENNVSLGFIGSDSGYIKGLSVGGGYSFVKNETKGLQLAFFTSMTYGRLHGLQSSLFFNYVEEDVVGGQVGLISSLAFGELTGFQAGYVFNYVEKNLVGLQLSAVNVSRGAIKGMQFGLLNISGESERVDESSNIYSKGFQIGFLNYSSNIDGGQFLVVNVARRVRGVQLGFLNISRGLGELDESSDVKSKGFQGGLLNYSSNIDGVQFGLLNIAKKVRGLQLGVINISNKIEGLPIGLVNFSLNGQLKLESSMDRDVHLISLVSGSKYGYSVLHFNLDSQEYGGVGYGLSFPFKKIILKSDYNFILIGQTGKSDKWEGYLFRAGADYHLYEGFYLSGTLNHYIPRKFSCGRKYSDKPNQLALGINYDFLK